MTNKNLKKNKTQNKHQLPAGWVETTLGEVAGKMYSGGTPSTSIDEYYNGNIPWIRTQEVNFNYIKDTEIKITEKGVNNSSAKWIPKDTVIIAMYGNSAGRVAYSKIKATTNQACCNFVSNTKKSNPKFIFFNLLNRYNEIKGMANGAAQQNLNVGNLRNLKILLPPLPQQKAIAGVLSAFDDKIELLREQNKTLEQIGQEIFKEWFLPVRCTQTGGRYKVGDKLPKGWRVGKIGEELETFLGGTPSKSKKEFWTNGNIPWINSGKVNEFRIINETAFITEEAVKKSATKILPKGTVVLAITGATLGQYSRLEIDACFNQSVVGIKENSVLHSSYIYFWLANNIQSIISHASGGAHQHINKENINQTELIIPDNNSLKRFYNLVDPLMDKISENMFQIQTLSQTRDTLLPKLMKGEIILTDE